MMQLAENMRLKLLANSSTQSNSGDEEMGSKQDMQDWLLSVGIVSPVQKKPLVLCTINSCRCR
jgi:ESCRT-II complex subunit VPS36